MHFELMWRGNANLIGDYPSLSAALTTVRRSITRNGEPALSGLQLIVDDDDGIIAVIAEGEDLCNIALGRFAEEMWPPSEPNPAPDRLAVPSLERAEEIITEWAGVRTIHDAGGATMYDTTGVIHRPKSG